MFEEYYNHHRRLITLITSIITSLVLILLFYHIKNILISSVSYQPSVNHLIIPNELPNRNLPHIKSIPISKNFLHLFPSLKRVSNGVLSSIKFINSPFLELQSESNNIIPLFVLSKASNIEIRDAIRRTWAFEQLHQNNTIKVKIFFLVGIDDFTIQRTSAEQYLFDDIIQVSLPDIDSFNAYKELSAILWMRSYLPNAPFYIKTEDDIIINMKVIIDKLLPTIESIKNENLVIGWFGSEHSIQRGNYQKFVDALISPLYANLHYAMGLLYIITSGACDRMLDALSHIDIIEYPGDTFVTGILREAAHVQIKDLSQSGEDYKYEFSNGACGDTFKKNFKLLFCTSSLRITTSRSVSEYFSAWNTLISEH